MPVFGCRARVNKRTFCQKDSFIFTRGLASARLLACVVNNLRKQRSVMAELECGLLRKYFDTLARVVKRA